MSSRRFVLRSAQICPRRLQHAAHNVLKRIQRVPILRENVAHAGAVSPSQIKVHVTRAERGEQVSAAASNPDRASAFMVHRDITS